MSKTKADRQSGLSRLESGVSSLVGQSIATQAAITAEAEGRDGRGRPGNAGEIGRDAAGRYKLTADVASGRKGQVDEMAIGLGLSKADVVDAALANMYTLFKAGKINLDLFKIYVPHKNQPGKVTMKLNLPDEFIFSS